MINRVRREMFRGDSLGFEIEMANPETNAPLSLAGAKFWFTAKHAYADPDERAAIRLDSDPVNGRGGITIVDEARGLARVDIPPIATRAFADGVVNLVYDVQIKEAGGAVSTVEIGTLSVYPDVTRAI